MNSIFNPELVAAAILNVAEKQAFIPGGGDPSAGGGGDPSMGGGDPNAQAAAPPAPAPAPAAPAPALQTVEPIKPKIDINVTMLQVLKILAKIADSMGIPIPASEMVATQSDLTQMGMQQQNGAAGGQQQSSIPPIAPIQGAAPGKTASDDDGTSYDTGKLQGLGNVAASIGHILRARQGHA